jgi:hypothetical protein
MVHRSVALLVLLLGAASTAADEPQPVREQVPFGQGTHAFRAVFKVLGAKPLEKFEQLFDQPAGKLLVVLGDTQFLDPELTKVKNFIKDGGAVLIATDQPTSGEMFTQLGVQVSGQFVRSPRSHAYRRELTDCPLVLEIHRRNEGQSRHPLFEGLSQEPSVATNLASRIVRMSNCVPVATLFVRGEGFTLTIPGLRGREFPDQVLFGVTGPIFWKGKLLVLADHSIFINDMMQADNDNLLFAYNVASWLTDNGKRTEVLFYDEGGHQASFEVPLKYPTFQYPPIEALVPLANQMLAAVENDNLFNKALVQLFGGHGAVLRTGLLVLTLALLLYGLYRFLHARHRVEPKVPRLPTQLAVLAQPLPALEQRHQAVLARGNLSEAARELARQAFTTLGVPPAAGADMPAFTVAGSWWQRLVWGRRVRRLWELAALGRGRRVSPAGLRSLAAALHELHAAAAGGKLHFAAAK